MSYFAEIGHKFTLEFYMISREYKYSKVDENFLFGAGKTLMAVKYKIGYCEDTIFVNTRKGSFLSRGVGEIRHSLNELYVN